MNRKSVRRLLRRLGWDVTRYKPLHDADARRIRFIADHGVDCVLDVGAHDGGYGRRLRDHGYRGRIVSFEPRLSAFAALRDRAQGDAAWECHRLALGAADGTATIRISGSETSSSLLAITDRHISNAPETAVVSREDVPLRTLDSVAGELFPEARRVMLKLDVQGYEKDVIDGAAAVLELTRIVECEISFVELYQGQPLHLELFARFAALGFVPAAIEPVVIEQASGRMLQIDATFLRE